MKTIANNKNFPAVWEDGMRTMNIVLKKAHEKVTPESLDDFHKAIKEARIFLHVLECMSCIPEEIKE